MENTSLNTICNVRTGYIGARTDLHWALYVYPTSRVCYPLQANISRTVGLDRYQFGSLGDIEYMPIFINK